MNAQKFSGLLLCLLAAACILIVVIGFRKVLNRLQEPESNRRKLFRNTLLVVSIWVLLLGVLSQIGIFAAPGLPPRPMITVVIALGVLFSLSFTTRFKAVLMATPLHWLVAFQVFRVGVELWFWFGYQTGVFPKIMTFEGANWDIVAGLLAPPAAWAMYRWPGRQRAIAVVFNIAGMLFLLNTLRAAALSMPSPLQQYPFDERLLLLGTFPFIYLPGVLVVMGLGFHILSLRQVYLNKSKDFKSATRTTPTRLNQSIE